MYRSLESWSSSEIKNFKQCVRLGGINIDLISLTIPQKPTQEIQHMLANIQSDVTAVFKRHRVIPPQSPAELQFTLGCLWDIAISKNPKDNSLFPTLSAEQENQLVQLILRYRKDNKQETTPKSLNIQFTPKNLRTETKMNQFGHKTRLQLAVGRNKKITSIITHLNKKWTVAIDDGEYLRLTPLQSSKEINWTKDDNSVTVSHIYASLHCKRALIQLEYEIVGSEAPQNSEPLYNICFTPSVESHLADLIHCAEPQTKTEEFVLPVGLHEESTNEFPSTQETLNSVDKEFDLPNPIPISSQIYDNVENSLPITPFKPHGSIDELSRDGFSPATRSLKYEGKCRDYWYQLEQSVDYSTFYTKKRKRNRESVDKEEPQPKRRLLS